MPLNELQSINESVQLHYLKLFKNGAVAIDFENYFAENLHRFSAF